MLRTLSLVLLLLASSVQTAWAQDVLVEKYDVEIPKELFVPYTGVYADRFPDGFTVGIGSGMTYVGKARDGARVFYAIGDRGPNADAPKFELNGKPTASKMFPAPKYAPSYGAIRVKDGHAVLASLITLKDAHMRPISGRAIPIGSVGSTGEVPLDDSLKQLAFDPEGLDTEGIDIDKKDKRFLWICDEYGPFIAKIDGYTGKIVRKYTPGVELPMIAASRQPNRGMEGIAVTPSNKVLAAIQSICDVDGKVKESRATFIRLMLLDPETNQVKQYAYPFEAKNYARSADAMIGDLYAISETRFILVERGKNADGKGRIPVFVIDLADATDISDVKARDGGELETVADRAEVEALGVKYVDKTRLIDIKEHGWKPAKAEGVALLPDMRTLVVTSDNDFGFTFKVVDPVDDANGKPVTKAAAYTVDPSGQVKYKGQPVNTRVELTPTGTASQIWFFTLPKRVTDY
ncbi:esterase-like activity of phytase family protein [Pseudodesulfovibrio indicus]|uniref:esterase-like activity of phytase family protein n=1 Tax=Pseudodesulfovibrio indicus TaxID=1716143 RepID=UPI002930712D|nr:esterase-like activity of phytase family protein [Pseudodesulfovibrio indicus]